MDNNDRLKKDKLPQDPPFREWIFWSNCVQRNHIAVPAVSGAETPDVSAKETDAAHECKYAGLRLCFSAREKPGQDVCHEARTGGGPPQAPCLQGGTVRGLALSDPRESPDSAGCGMKDENRQASRNDPVSRTSLLPSIRCQGCRKPFKIRACRELPCILPAGFGLRDFLRLPEVITKKSSEIKSFLLVFA
jgi:hypothetical protein